MDNRIYLVIFAILVGSTAGEVTLIRSSLAPVVISTIILALAGMKAALVALSSIVLLALLAIVPLLTISFLQIPHTFH